MANTYSSLYIHLVFAVKYRDAKLLAVYRPRIFQYMRQIITRLGHQPLAIGGTDNHIHILICYNLTQLIPDLVRELKSATTKFINQELLLSHRFEWQRGYGAFSHSHRDLPAVIQYIDNQPMHHNNMTFAQEVRLMLERSGIAFENEFLPEDV